MSGLSAQAALPAKSRRARLRDQYRWRWKPALRRRIYGGWGVLARSLSALMPAPLRLALRELPSPTRPLDYRAERLCLVTDSWVEYDKRARSCAKEPETVAWMEGHVRPGETVYDIGANVGAYSLILGRRVGPAGRVYAFEPSFANFAQLSRNVLLNGLSGQVMPLHLALADHTAVGRLHYSSLAPGAALHGLHQDTATTTASLAVLAISLDELVARFQLDRPHHIKLDVDGIEHAILLGGRRVLAHPGLRTILVESEAGRPGSDDIASLLAEVGFELEAEHVHNANPLHPGPYVKNCLYRRLR
ncbi:MAG TPA: FkbM family methyltransferase [Gammaproteobacteria bacterium]|nr:FkbM family methyltransferase [Gammaproteobacteria bacterium]